MLQEISKCKPLRGFSDPSIKLLFFISYVMSLHLSPIICAYGVAPLEGITRMSSTYVLLVSFSRGELQMPWLLASIIVYKLIFLYIKTRHCKYYTLNTTTKSS